MRLYTFAISHFSEKARWALDYEGLAYEERRLLPGLHIPVIRSRARRTSVPVLEHEGRWIQGSGKILDYLASDLGARRLAPSPELSARAVELEARFDRAFGLGTQRIFYDFLLPERETTIDLWTQQGPRCGRLFYTLAYPGVSRAVRRMYKIEPGKVATAIDEFRAVMDATDALLERHPYVLGETLTRVDIGLAALLAPLCGPPEHLMRWPAIPASGEAFVAQFRGRPTWDYVLRMYRNHRSPAVTSAQAAIRAERPASDRAHPSSST